MKSGKKTWIIITIIIILILLLAAGGAVIYFGTDLLKSNTQVFYQYAMKNADILGALTDKNITNGEALKSGNPYTSHTEITFASDDEEMDKTLKELKVTAEGKTDVSNKKAIVDAKAEYKGAELFKASYIQDQDKYALKSDEIVTAYVGIENKDLQQLAKKMGVADTTLVPNQIDFEQLSNLWVLSENEKQNIINIYSPVLLNNIPKEKYTKTSDVNIDRDGVNYKATQYTLSLTGQDLANVEIAILNALKEDSVTLNMLVTKAKILGLGTQYTSVNELTKVIDEEINRLGETQVSSQEKLRISIYVADKQLLKTEILIVDQEMITISYQKSNNKENASIEVVGLSNVSYDNAIKIVKETSDQNTSVQANITMQKDEKTTTANINWLTSINEDGIMNTATILSQINDKTIECDYTQEIKFVDAIDAVPTLNNANSMVLNTYPEAQLKQLVTAIQKRTQTVIDAKLKTIFGDNIINTNNQTISDEEIKNFNNQFANFEGENLAGTNVNTLIDIIDTNNTKYVGDANRKVVLQLEGIEYVELKDQKENIKASIDTAKFYVVSFNYDANSKLIKNIIVTRKQ